MGTLTIDQAKEIFAEQIKGLVAGGVDAILIETMSDLAEVEAAVKAAQEVAPGLPIVVTFSFDTNLRTMMGVKPEMAVKQISALGVRLIGANCGRGTDEMKIIAQELASARQPGTYLITQSNAGLPKLVGDEFIYDGTPEEMAKYAKEMKEIGINVIGSCCGSTPKHTKAISEAVK
jgi:5-methyltetrahydrofolate--homocysteine methyltransferase